MRAEGVADVLAQLRNVLAGADREQRSHVVPPHTRAAATPGRPRFTMLLVEDARHLVAIVGSEVRREQSEQTAEPAVACHASLVFGMSRFARAIPSAVSIRDRLGACDVATEGSEPMVPTPFVIERRVGSRGALDDDAFLDEAPDDGVQRARAERDLAARPPVHFLDDGVTVFLPIGQGDQDLEHAGGQGQQRFGIGAFHTCIVRL